MEVLIKSRFIINTIIQLVIYSISIHYIIFLVLLVNMILIQLLSFLATFNKTMTTLQIILLLLPVIQLLFLFILFQLVFCLDGVYLIPSNSVRVLQYSFHFPYLLRVAFKFKHIAVITVLLFELSIFIIINPIFDLLVLLQILNL